MKAKQDLALKSASCPASFAVAVEQHEQRAKNLRSFKAKYDAMLYMVEFMASFQQLAAKNPKQSKAMEEVKSLADQARNKMGIMLHNFH